MDRVRTFTSETFRSLRVRNFRLFFGGSFRTEGYFCYVGEA